MKVLIIHKSTSRYTLADYYKYAFQQLGEGLDKLPFPTRDLLDNRLYFNPKLGVKPWIRVLAMY